MKAKLSFFLLFIFSFSVLYAQDEENQSAFLFEDFEEGVATYKNGSGVAGLFNYNLLDGKIMFLDDGEVMELATPNEFSNIKINGRTFVNVKNGVFYERVTCGSTSLFVWWKFQAISKGKNAGYGSTSQTSAITNVAALESPGSYYRLKSSEKFDWVDKSSYQLYIDGKYRSFNSAKSFIKLFKKHENEISAYIDEEKIDFKNLDDIKKLVGFASQFIS